MGIFGRRQDDDFLDPGEIEWLPDLDGQRDGATGDAPVSNDPADRHVEDWGFDNVLTPPPAPAPEPSMATGFRFPGNPAGEIPPDEPGRDLASLVDELRDAVDAGLTAHMRETRTELIDAVRQEAGMARERLRLEVEAAKAEMRAEASGELDEQVRYLRDELRDRSAGLASAAGAAAAEAAADAIDKRTSAVVAQLRREVDEAIAGATRNLEESGRERIRAIAKVLHEESRTSVQGEIERLRNEREQHTAEMKLINERAIEEMRRQQQQVADEIREVADRTATELRTMVEEAIGKVAAAEEEFTSHVDEATRELDGRIAEVDGRLSRKLQRQELKLVREEQSKRVEAAIRKLDERGEELTRELARIAEEAATTKAGEAATRLEARITEFEAKLDRARDSIDTDVRRAAEAAARAEAESRRANRAGGIAPAGNGVVPGAGPVTVPAASTDDAPVDLAARRAEEKLIESRRRVEELRRAEADAARRIEAAEQTIRDLMLDGNRVG